MKQLRTVLALGALGWCFSSCISAHADRQRRTQGPAEGRGAVRGEESCDSPSYGDRVEIVHFTIGEMEMRDEDYWRPLDQPFSLGIDYSSTSTHNGIGAEVGFQFWGDSTGHSASDEDLSGLEVSAGMRTTWNAGEAGPHPYIGVGAAFVAATLEGPSYDETDGSLGLYGHVGITMPLGPVLEIGLDYRVLRGTESEFDGLAESDFDYDRLSLVLGWSF